MPSPEKFGDQLRKMRLRVINWEGKPTRQEDLVGAAELHCHYTLVSHWERGIRVPDHFHLVQLVKFFAGKPGCLETPIQAQNWALLLGETLTEGELRAAFPKADPGEIEKALDRVRDFMEEWRAAGPTPAQLRAFNLPARRGDFLGRRADLERVLNVLNSDWSSVCLIEGMTGVGKSTLALEVAYACAGQPRAAAVGLPWPEFRFIIWIGDLLAKNLTLRGLLDTIARPLGYSDRAQAPLDKKREIVTDLLAAQQPVLLIVNSFETVTNRDRIADFMVGVPPGVKVLLTSREGEKLLADTFRRYPAAHIHLRGLPDAQALLFLRQEAKSLAGHRHETERARLEAVIAADDTTLLPLVKITEGNPKALALALSRIADEATPLEMLVCDLHAAADSVADLLDYLCLQAWERCGEDARALWRVIPFFVAPVQREALAAAAGLRDRRFYDALRELHGRSLLDDEDGLDGEVRYRAHNLVRAFAGSKLREVSEWEREARERWVDYYAGNWDDLSHFQRIEEELRNRIEVVNWLYQAESRPEDAARIVIGMKYSLCRLGWYPEISGLVDKREFEAEACRIIRKEVKGPIAVFLGAGDLARGMIRELRREGVTCIAMDRKITVGWPHADQQFLNGDEGLRNTDWVLRMLEDLAPENSSQLPDRAKPMLIGEYHGFDVDQIFSVADSIGYRVIPSKKAAIVAMDKVKFLEHFKAIPEIAEHLLPQTAFDSVPVEIAGNLKENRIDDGDTEAYIEEVTSKIATETGFPCVLKAAISEFGYGQSVVHRKQDIRRALKAMIEQAETRRVNPNNRFVVQKYIPDPIEVMQVVVRHLDRREQPRTTCLPPIWNTVVPNEEDFGGPFVFEDVFLLEDVSLLEGEVGEAIERNRQTIEAISKRVVDSLGNELGVYGVELLVKDGNLWLNRLSVRTQDTMMVTEETSEQNDCFQLFAKAVLRKGINPSAIQTLQHSGAVRAVLWRWQSARLDRFEGMEAAEALSDRYGVRIKVDVYEEKRQLRPLRRMGIISVQAPKEVSREKIQKALDEAREKVKIIPRPHNRE